MWELLSWTAIVMAVAGLGFGALILARGGGPADLRNRFFAAKPEPRVEVVEVAAMDAKRRLVLIRRDDVEHLVMTGGPVDVVIETGITAPPRRETTTEVSEPSDFTLAPRGFGQRIPETAPAVAPPPLARPASSIDRSLEHELSLPVAPQALGERS